MKTKRNSIRDPLIEAAEWRLISLLFDCPSNDWFKTGCDSAAPMPDKKVKHAAAAGIKTNQSKYFY